MGFPDQAGYVQKKQKDIITQKSVPEDVHFKRGDDKKMDAATLTLVVLGIAAFFFATEIIPLAVTAMGAAIALGFLGVLTPAEVFAGLSNSTVVLFAGMFVIGAAMFQTGLAQKIGVEVVKKSGTDEKRLMVALMVITIGLSSV